MANETTKRIKGVGAEVRGDGYTWKAVIDHLGGGGTRYYKFNGRWILVTWDRIPSKTYRHLRTKLREAILDGLS